MSTGCSNLDWPLCLGIFDEESCRFFLRQIGEKIVPSYPFVLGMEEVYGQILERYGYEGSSDALSVLQELLEDDESAAGFGDDGDVWRSWRHSWRHRNDGNLNPFIPRVGRLALLPPTATRIRLFKAANFVTQQNSVCAASNSCDDRFEAHESSASNPVVQECRYGSDTISPDSLHIARTSMTQLARAFTVSDFDMNGKRFESRSTTNIESDFQKQPFSPHRNCLMARNGIAISHLRGGELDPKSQRRSLPLTPERNKIVPRGLTIEKDSKETLDDMQQYGRNKQEQNERIDHESVLYTEFTKFNDIQSNIGAEAKQSDLLKINQHSTQNQILEASHNSSESRSIASGVKTTSGRGAVNRQARLIDGALFNGKLRKEKPDEQGLPIEEITVKATLKRSPQRLSLPNTRPKTAPRESWVRVLWSRIRHEHSNKPSSLHRRQHSLVSCTSISPVPPRAIMPPPRKKTTTSISPLTNPNQSSRFGLDGAFDKQSNSSNAEIDINKPLPLSPRDRIRRSVSSEAERLFFAPHPDDLCSLRGVSPASSPRTSTGTSTRDSDSSAKPPVDIPVDIHPVLGNDSYTREKLESRSESTQPNRFSRISFTSIANQNPYVGNYTSMTHPIPPLPPPMVEHQVSSDEWPFRKEQTDSTTKEEHDGAVKHVDDGERPENLQIRSPSQDRTSLSHSVSPETTRSRGIFIPECDSNQASPKMDPIHRPRSPLKKFFGIGKPNNSNEYQLPSSPTKPLTPSSSNRKLTFKHWGNKLRHGFLTSDEDQLRQERIMEQHTAHDDVFVVPPSKANRSTFPVSLRPVDQARLVSEVELLICSTANKFLLCESEAGRITAESVSRTKLYWESRNKPQVVEFLYDLGTQRDLIMANLKTVNFHGDAAFDAISLSSILHQWKVIAREMNPRTLCNPDSVVRRWLHDLRRILETLGTSDAVMQICDSLTFSTQRLISNKEREKAHRRACSVSTEAPSLHRRSASDDNCYHPSHVAAPQSLPSRSGRTERVQPLPASNSYKNGMRQAYPLVHTPPLTYPRKVTLESYLQGRWQNHV